MSFLNPLFLFGLAAAALPIIIHLFTRRRPKERPFPSLEFLSEVNQSEIRRVRIKQWLLLLLRTLAVAAIALAMSRPAVRGAAAGGAAATSVVVLVDRSGSMGAAAPGAAGGGGTLMAETRRVAEGVLATLGPQDELMLVPYDRAPQPVTPQPSSDLDRLRAAAQALEATAHTTDHGRALELAAAVLARSTALNRELYWISDFQSAGFATAPGAPPLVLVPSGPWSQARAYLIPMASQSRRNAAVTDAALAPGEGDAAVSVTVTSHGVPAGDLAVEVLGADGRTALGRGFVDLPERGEGSTLVPLARVPELGGVASIPDDALELDNRRAFAAGGSGALRVVLREDGGASALRLALEAGSPASGLAVEAVAPAQLADRLRDADALVIHDVERLSPPELQAALDFHRAGGALLLAPGARADADSWNASLLRELGAGTLGPLERPGPGGSWRMSRTAAGHPALAGFETRPGEPLSAARFLAVRAFRPAGAARVLLEFDRGHPALVEAPRAMIFTAPLDPASTDFAVSGAFLPLMHQVARVLARGTAAGSLLPGERYTAPGATGVWSIQGQDGREVPAELVEEGGATRLVSEPIERPGLYRVQRGGTLRSTFAVNPDPRESDLTIAAESALLDAFPSGRARVIRPGADLVRRVREARFGRELWSWFVIAALALLAAETVIGRLGLASRAPATAAAGEPAPRR